MPRLELDASLRQLKELTYWSSIRSVGSARVECIYKSGYPDMSMVYIRVGPDNDLSYAAMVHAPALFNISKGDTVEVFVRIPRKLFNRELGGPAVCQVAIRPFSPHKFGKIEPEEEKVLLEQLRDEGNRYKIWNERAFFRRFLNANIKPITFEDIDFPGV